MQAVRKAIEIGAPMVYLEVRACRDGALVAWPSMQRLIDDQPVHLSDHTLPQWQRLTEKSDAPTLPIEDVIALIGETRSAITIDLHASGGENILARMLRRYRIPHEDTIVVCPNANSQLIMRSMDPNIPLGHRFAMDHTAALVPCFVDDLDVDAVFWPMRLLKEATIGKLKARGIAVYASQVNLAQEMRTLIVERGVDGILTPYPELLLTVSESKKREIEQAA